MKLLVKVAFRDGLDHVTIHRPGDILDVDDAIRIRLLKASGLCTVYKGKSSSVDPSKSRNK